MEGVDVDTSSILHAHVDQDDEKTSYNVGVDMLRGEASHDGQDGEGQDSRCGLEGWHRESSGDGGSAGEASHDECHGHDDEGEGQGSRCGLDGRHRKSSGDGSESSSVGSATVSEAEEADSGGTCAMCGYYPLPTCRCGTAPPDIGVANALRMARSALADFEGLVGASEEDAWPPKGSDF